MAPTIADRSRAESPAARLPKQGPDANETKENAPVISNQLEKDVIVKKALQKDTDQLETEALQQGAKERKPTVVIRKAVGALLLFTLFAAILIVATRKKPELLMKS